jgi:hypothetical protein
MVSRYRGVTVQRYNGTRRNGTKAQWHKGAMVSRSRGATVQRYKGTKAQWHKGAMVIRCKCLIIEDA